MVETIEPKRSDPSGWIGWLGGLVFALLAALILTIAWGVYDVGLRWVILLAALILVATLVLPAWAVLVNED